MISHWLNHLLLLLLQLLSFEHLLPYSDELSKIPFIVLVISKQLLQLLSDYLRSLYLLIVQILESLLLVAF